MKKGHACRQAGFTLIEILVVTTIIGMLATVGMVTYSSFVKQSRDARRKADLEQVRAALEMYRSNVGTYPAALIFGTGSLADVNGNIYLTKLPQDPQPTKYSYYYSSSAPYSDYVLGSYVEQSSPGCSSVYSCASTSGSQDTTLNFSVIKPVYAQGAPGLGGPPVAGTNCNYCLGPLGAK